VTTDDAPAPAAAGPAEADRRWRLDDFDYPLPPELVAQHPLPERSASRLLDGRGAVPADRHVRDLPALLAPGDLLVFNDTQVIRARLRGEKATGGAVEALVERLLPGDEAIVQLRASKSPRPGTRIAFAGGAFEAEVLGRAGHEGEMFHLRFPSQPLALLHAHGEVPLPPYIQREGRAPGAEDEARYQSVLAARPGAVAAPTASLHFDETLLEALEARGVARTTVTLHVGAGTFQPVRVQHIAEHRMHSEWYEVPAAAAEAVNTTRARGGRVLAVGTTALRALESAALRAGGAAAGAGPAPIAPCAGETELYVTPGFRFAAVDLLLTNFHLPRSTLLMLVSAFTGHAHAMALYHHAVESRYRFFSYGDAMLLERSRAA
jgi:S-adenosylmethionine:tRNA ribosyltransferase-isomerase